MATASSSPLGQITLDGGTDLVLYEAPMPHNLLM
jgi:hypothetical protein